ncbi:hypothetical protein N0V88_007986 [Collariella sp. IMI 366227]|nr:hypothetical protein N0V88_007986 [Collariella sp. IMI 366227]
MLRPTISDTVEYLDDAQRVALGQDWPGNNKLSQHLVENLRYGSCAAVDAGHPAFNAPVLFLALNFCHFGRLNMPLLIPTYKPSTIGEAKSPTERETVDKQATELLKEDGVNDQMKMARKAKKQRQQERRREKREVEAERAGLEQEADARPHEIQQRKEERKRQEVRRFEENERRWQEKKRLEREEQAQRKEASGKQRKPPRPTPRLHLTTRPIASKPRESPRRRVSSSRNS